MERLGRQLYLTHKLVHELLDRHLADVGASGPQWFVMRALAQQPGVSHRELAEQVQLTAPTLTHHLDRMEADHLLVRTRDAEDRRVVRIELTPRGRARCAQLSEAADRADRDLRSHLSEDDVVTLQILLTRLYAQLDGEHRSEGAARAQ